MENQFKQKMESLTDEKLIEVIIRRRDYQPLAVEAALEEGRKRGLLGTDSELIINDDRKLLAEKARDITEREILKDRYSVCKASRCKRFANYLIDTNACYIIAVLLIMIYDLITSFSGPDLVDALETAGNSLILIPIIPVYYIVFEALSGKTLGKFITRTSVLRNDFKRPTFKNIILRTLCRFIPIDPLTFLFENYGLHDNLSKTIVVDDKASNSN